MKLFNYLYSKFRRGKKTPSQLEIINLQERGLTIGQNVDIFSEYPFDSLYPGLISIGDYVTISSNVKILAHDASMGYVTGGSCKIGIVEIGNHVFIGHGVTILCNVRIGDYAIIGAGSVVTQDVPSCCVYAGNPARFIKKIDQFAQEHISNQNNHVCFNKPWRELTELKKDDWDDIKEELKTSYGYIIRK